MAKAEFEADAVRPRFPRRPGKEPGCQLYRRNELCGKSVVRFIEGIAVCQDCIDVCEAIRAESALEQQSRVQERMRATA